MKINETVRKFLIDNSQEEYRKFSLSLLPPDTRILGVRLPLIKKYSKELCRGDWRKYLKYAKSYWYEEIMLQGFVIGSAKCEINERVDLIKGFLPKIKNWGICDSFSMGIKILEAQRPIYFKFLESCQKSGEPFIRRYATVSMLSKYVDDEYIERVLELLLIKEPENYYVKMATAWALSVCLLKYRNLSETEIIRSGLEKDTLKMTLRKVKESRRYRLVDKLEIANKLKKAER